MLKTVTGNMAYSPCPHPHDLALPQLQKTLCCLLIPQHCFCSVDTH